MPQNRQTLNLTGTKQRRRGRMTPSVLLRRSAPAVAAAVSRMFYHMGRIFEDRCLTDTMQRGIQIDRKRRRQLLEKKMAMGHKADDHENEEIQLK